jgi:hypothetical protein
MKYRKYLPGICMVIVLLLIGTFNTYAQFTPPDLPCDPEDPSSCPIDTGVWLLVAAALIFATAQLYRKQKMAKA